MKKAFTTLLVASASAFSLEAALVCYAPLDDQLSTIQGGMLNTTNSIYKDGALFGSGASQAGVGKWKLTLDTPVQLNKDWSFSFHSFVVEGEKSNQWGSALIGTNDNAYANSYSDGFQVYLQGSGNLVGKINGASETSLSGYTSGSWNHVGISCANGVLSVYINGKVANTLTVNYADGATLKNLLNNNGSSGATANMGVKDIAVWDNALSAYEMQQLASGVKPTEIVPEPSTSALGLLGLGLLIFKRRRN